MDRYSLTRMGNRSRGAVASVRGQRGVILIIALLVLVAMTIASIGLLRSVDTANVIAGNLSFRKDATQQVERAFRAASQTMLAIPLADRNADVPASSYFASFQPTDKRGIPQALLDAPSPSVPGTGTGWANEVAIPIGDATGGGLLFRYALERMCTTAGAVETSDCRVFSPPGSSSREAFLDPLGVSAQAYVRATVRVDGPKNTVIYFQSMLR